MPFHSEIESAALRWHNARKAFIEADLKSGGPIKFKNGEIEELGQAECALRDAVRRALES